MAAHPAVGQIQPSSMLVGIRTEEQPAPRKVEHLTSEDVLRYDTKRRFPLPLDGIYRMLPHFLTVRVLGGSEHLPRTGSAIIAFKHQGFFDQYVLRLVLEKATNRKEDIFPFAWAGELPGKKTLRMRLMMFFWRIVFLFCNHGHPTLPIRQETWREDLKRRMDEGPGLVIHAPEGYPCREMREAKPGTAIMQNDLQVPVIPIAMWGFSPFTYPKILLLKAVFVEWLKLLPFLGRLANPYYPAEKEAAHFLIGEPIHPFPEQESPEHRRRHYLLQNDRIMHTIASMMPEQLRGYYRDKVKGAA